MRADGGNVALHASRAADPRCRFAFGVVDLDVARDLQAAWDIATGCEFPLAHPVINASAHPGPLWCHLLALPSRE